MEVRVSGTAADGGDGRRKGTILATTPSMARPTRAVTAITASLLAGWVIRLRRWSVPGMPTLLWDGVSPLLNSGANRAMSSSVH